MRRVLLLFALLLLPGLVWAQGSGFTQVSAQVQDLNGALYVNCKASISFVPPSDATGQSLVDGSVFQTDVPIFNCDSFANFTQTIVDNSRVSPFGSHSSQWRFNISAADGTHGFFCLITVAGQTMNITPLIQACAPILPAQGGCCGGGLTPHNLLSVTHPDTTPFSPPLRGDTITGQGAAPSFWTRLPLGLNKQVVKSNATDALWQYSLEVLAAGGSVGTRSVLNFIAGTNIGLGITDNSAQNRIDTLIDAKVTVDKNGVLVGTEAALNLIEGTNVTLTGVNNPGAGRVDVTINSSTGIKTCMILIGADNGSALANADIGPQIKQCQLPYAATVVEIDVAADGGTPNVIVAKRHCTVSPCVPGANETVSNLVSSALATAASGGTACSKTGATACFDTFTTASATLQNASIAIGDWIELVSGTAGGVAKSMRIAVHFTVN